MAEFDNNFDMPEESDEFDFDEFGDSQYSFDANATEQAVELDAFDSISAKAKEKFAQSFPDWDLEPPEARAK